MFWIQKSKSRFFKILDEKDVKKIVFDYLVNCEHLWNFFYFLPFKRYISQNLDTFLYMQTKSKKADKRFLNQKGFSTNLVHQTKKLITHLNFFISLFSLCLYQKQIFISLTKYWFFLRKSLCKWDSEAFKLPLFLFQALCLHLSPRLPRFYFSPENKSTTRRVKCENISQQVWLKKYLLNDAPTYSNIYQSFKLREFVRVRKCQNWIFHKTLEKKIKFYVSLCSIKGMVFDEKWTDTQANLNLWVIFFTKVHDDSRWNFNEAFSTFFHSCF